MIDLVLQLGIRVRKCLSTPGLITRVGRWIGNSPVRGGVVSGPNRTGLACCIVTYCNDESLVKLLSTPERPRTVISCF
jgi:hypothetical protein